jgi:hypothetical protein
VTYLAELDPASRRVLRVIACDDEAWAVQRLGGTWIVTKIADARETYAGPGMYHSDTPEQRFVTAWRQPSGLSDAYPADVWVWHRDRMWQSTTANNQSEPGVADWTERVRIQADGRDR